MNQITREKEYRKEKTMYEVILLLLVYIIAISCIAIMNKISPGNRMYTAWVAFVCVALTAFVIVYEVLGKAH